MATISSTVIIAVVSLLVCQAALTSGQNDVQCNAVGLSPYPADCAKFYQCAAGNSHPFIKRCAEGTYFSDLTRRCGFLAQANCRFRPVLGTNQPRPRTFVRPSNEYVITVVGPVGHSNTYRVDQCEKFQKEMNYYTSVLLQQHRAICDQECQNNRPTLRVICRSA